jgi:hypothetical protein
MSETVIALSAPVEFGGEVISALTLRSPKGKDLRHISYESLASIDFGTVLDLGGRLAGRPPEFMDQLDVVDVAQVSKAVLAFLSDIN